MVGERGVDQIDLAQDTGVLWMLYWTFSFYKMRWTSGLAKELLGTKNDSTTYSEWGSGVCGIYLTYPIYYLLKKFAF